MKNITDEFIEYLWSICPDKINEETYHQAKRCFVDYIGVTFAGAAIIKDKVQYFLEKTKTNVGNNHIIGLGKSIATTSVAALLNGISAHVMELDDGHRAAMVHSGAPIISALLADAY